VWHGRLARDFMGETPIPLTDLFKNELFPSVYAS